MIESPSVTLAMVAGLAACCALASAADEGAIFADDFNRADAGEIGNEWSSKGAVVLKDGAMRFRTREEEFRPRTRRTFPVQDGGRFTVSFRMDWLREREGTWGFYMQLGHSAAMPARLVYREDLSKGIGVNLLWGGGELVGHRHKGSFGYLKDGRFEPLFVVNDAEVEDTVVDEPVVVIEVDVDAGTYAVIFDGRTYPDLPFDNRGPVDTIRFIADGCSDTGFSKSSIDDVGIRRSGTNG